MRNRLMTLPRFLLNNTLAAPALTDPLEAHVEYVYKNIYSVPYAISIKYSRERKLEPRRIHGIQHVTRVAIDIPVLANLYRRYGDQEALALTNDDIKLIQIAALFHDAARKNEGVDYWDKNSAWLLYGYLTKKLGVDPAKAKLLAEAAANKDVDQKYYELEITSDNKPRWITHRHNIPRKNIYQKLIHDADSLDIIRVMDFRAEYLDFYKEIAKYNQQAFKEMAKLIKEKRSLIERQGDSKGRMNLGIKSKYDHGKAYQCTMTDIKQFKHLYPMYDVLHANNTLLSGEALKLELLPEQRVAESKIVTHKSLNAAKDKGLLFVRGLSAPASVSSTRTKDYKSSAEIEAHKIYRSQGTPHRSVTLFHEFYAGQGIFILPNIDDLEDVHHTDVDSGRGKKSHIKASELSKEEKISKLEELFRNVQMGGSVKRFKNGSVMAHHEILYTVKDAAAIYYTSDPNHYNKATYNDSNPCTRHAPYLQALHIKQAFENETNREFPLFECSAIHDFIKPAPKFTNNQIITMWVDCVSYVMKKRLESTGQITDTMETLKILAIEGAIVDERIVRKQFPADRLYPPELASKVSEALEKAKTKCIEDHHKDVIERIKKGTLTALDDEAFYTLQHYPHLINQINNEIESECEQVFGKSNDAAKQSFLDSIYKDYYPELTVYNYFSSKISRIYFYAKKTHNINLISSIQEIARKKIDDKINYFNNFEEDSYFYLTSHLRDIIDYSVRFNLYDVYKNKINNLIYKIADYISQNKIIHLKELVTVVLQAGLLEDDVAKKLSEIVRINKIKYKDDASMMQVLFDLEKRINESCQFQLIPFVIKLEGGLSNPLKPIETSTPASKKRTYIPENELEIQSTRKTKTIKTYGHSPRKSPRPSTMSSRSTSSQSENVIYFTTSPSNESKEQTLRSSFHFEKGMTMTSSRIQYQLSPSSERKNTLKRTFDSKEATLRKSPRLQKNVDAVRKPESNPTQTTSTKNFPQKKRNTFFSNRFHKKKSHPEVLPDQTQEAASQYTSAGRFNFFKKRKIKLSSRIKEMFNKRQTKSV